MMGPEFLTMISLVFDVSRIINLGVYYIEVAELTPKNLRVSMTLALVLGRQITGFGNSFLMPVKNSSAHEGARTMTSAKSSSMGSVEVFGRE